MKTKIIYISGNELFDMADIRAAFEEVRAALSLGSDTILFGVPVDNDDALVSNTPEHAVVEPIIQTVANPEPEPVIDETPIHPDKIEEKPEKPATRRARKPAKVEPTTMDQDTYTEPEPEPTPENNNDVTPSVVPILSVLGSKPSQVVSDDSEKDEPNAESDTTVTESNDIVDAPVNDAETVTITDMIADEAPVPEHEKTLEELLESMTPLGEDAEKPMGHTTEPDDDESAKTSNETDTELDMTLEKLANEFVENQDKIGAPIKPAARGKIGKLKNILPFKKAKHDDSGLMGDLFGWAGAAANDEDFTVPGFFK